MLPHLLHIFNPTTTTASSFPPMIETASAAAAASARMLLGSEDELRGDATKITIPPSSAAADDDNEIESKPLISRSLSYTYTPPSATLTAKPNLNQKQRRRRVASDTSSIFTPSAARRQPFRRMGRAASDTYLITRLSFKLLGYLGVGYRWIIRFLALGCYAVLLFPGFIQVGYYYFFSSQIRRGVIYGDQPRNRLDLYLPKNRNGPKPVVAFVTGGAWIIGYVMYAFVDIDIYGFFIGISYKAWGSLLGQQLSERDIIVACIDYRNFPQGTIGDMVKDASQGISFVCNIIAEYGGDPNNVYLMGQSAGAHIASCALLEQAIKEARGEKTSWSVSRIKAYFGLSGGYNLFNLVDHFHSRGLYRSIFLSIMEGEESLRRYSPEVMVRDPNNKSAVSLLPRTVLFHGTADYSIPSDSSKNFAEVLQSLGVEAESVLYEGKTHTDLFLQDPMRGGRDDLFEDLVGMIHAGDSEAAAKDAKATPRKRLVPELMLRLARIVSPF